LSGAVTFGIGTAVQSLPIAEKIVAGAFMHGTSQGIMTGIQGGDPLSAFVSGAVSSIATGLWSTGGAEGKWQGVGGAWAKSDFGTLAFGTFAGGAGAQLSGGNFWQGAVTGLMVSGLNHVAHKRQMQELGNATIDVTDEIVGEATIRDYPTDKGGRYKTPLYKVVVSGTDSDGNLISKDFKAIRFGVKTNADGSKSTTFLAAGTYTVKDFFGGHYGNSGAFQIKGNYLIHLSSLNGADGNTGCIAIAGGRAMWNQFKNYISQLTFNSDLSNAARNGNIRLNIQYAQTPKLF
jgi:hypothetical protein